MNTCIPRSLSVKTNKLTFYIIYSSRKRTKTSHTEIKLKARRSKQTSNDTFTLLLLKRISVQLLVNVTISHVAKTFGNLL